MSRRATILLALLAAALLAACGTPADSSERPTAQPAAAHTVKPSPAKPSPTPKATHSAHPAATGRPAIAARITFVDVGQGDAIIIRSGSWTGLVDGGPPGSTSPVETQLAKLGARRIDTLVISHPDSDHVGGLPGVISDYDPRQTLMVNGAQTSAWGAVKGALVSAHTRVVRAMKGLGFTWGKVKARVLSPGSRISDDANQNSVVLLLNVAGKRILLTGDVTGANEQAVGADLARGPPVYLLKVAHHGSHYSTGSAFVDDVRPRFAVICVGANSYGHPSPDTIARLRARGTRIYSTQKNGTITLTIFSSGAARWSFSQSSRPVTGARAGSGKSATGGGGGRWVYITNTGECYHRGSCRFLSQSKLRISVKEAKLRGYRPCSICNPPG